MDDRAPDLDLRARPRLLIGVVHLAALPGAPGFCGSVEAVLRAAEADARALVEGGIRALVVENFGDAPFFPECVPAETVAGLARAVAAVRAAAPGLPVGVNVLRNDARAALGVCAVAGASFLRVNVHTGAMVTDQGLLQGRAAETLRERARLAPGSLLLADVHVKHAQPLGGGTIEVAALDTFRRGRADALVVSGSGTGSAPEAERVARVRAAVPEAPLLLGSGLRVDNARELLRHADGAIVGTALKHDGDVHAAVDPARVAALVRAVADLPPVVPGN